MSKQWPSVKIGDVVHQEREPVGSFDGDGLPVLGVTNVEGVTHTGVEASDDLAKYLRLRPGRFVFNPYRVNVGSIGLSSEKQDGICSPAYVVFAPTERIDANFLRYFLKSARGNQLINFHGNRGSVRSALRFDDLAQIEIPLPPLTEQRRVVARIEELAAQVRAARSLRNQAAEEAKALSHSCAEAVFRRLREKIGTKPISDVCNTITDGDHNTPQFREDGVRFIFVGNVSSGRLHFENSKRVSQEYFKSLKSHRLPKRGDILYSAVGATLGIPAVVDNDESFCFQRHIAILKPDRKKVDSQYFWHMLGSRTVFDKAWASTTGSAQPTIPLRAIRELSIPVPQLAEQLQIVAELDELQAEVDALKRLQADTATELDALLPSILDRALSGNL